MTTGQVSRATGISLPTVVAHIKRGWLPAEQNGPGGRYHIHPRDVIEWSRWNAERGRVWMKPTNYTKDFIDEFFPF